MIKLQIFFIFIILINIINNIESINKNFELSLEISNEYTEEIGNEYEWLEGKAIVEPHRDTILQVLVNDEYVVAEDDPNIRYVWLIEAVSLKDKNNDCRLCESNIKEISNIDELFQVVRNFEDNIYGNTQFTNNPSDILSGINVTYNFETPGSYNIKLYQINIKTNEFINGIEIEAECLYVRRELRSLTDDDREIFLNSIEVMYKVEDELGQKLFDKNYKSMDYFITKYSKLSNDESCNHMNNGLGFITQHISLLNEFENTLQSINPIISLPYWDTTIDGEESILTNEPQNFYDEQIFDPDWFGNYDSKTSSIKEGRWAGTSVLLNQWDDNHNSFGQSRSSTNFNENLYISRFEETCGVNSVELFDVPSCSSYQSLIENTNSWTSFSYALSSFHQNINVLIGGASECSSSYDLLRKVGIADELLDDIRKNTYVSHQYLWRNGLYSCPDSCFDDDGEIIESCSCNCPSLNEDLKSGNLDKYYENLFENDYVKDKIFADVAPTIRDKFIQMMCNTNIVNGDISDSSLFDPLIWPILTGMEKIYQHKKLKNDISYDDWTNENNAKIGSKEVSCTGHGKDDEIYWESPNSASNEKLTNYETLDIINPNNSYLDYIYDNFQFEHCS